MTGTLVHASECAAVFNSSCSNAERIGVLQCGELLLVLGVWKNPMKDGGASNYCDMFKVLTRHGLGFVNETEVSK